MELSYGRPQPCHPFHTCLFGLLAAPVIFQFIAWAFDLLWLGFLLLVSKRLRGVVMAKIKKDEARRIAPNSKVGGFYPLYELRRERFWEQVNAGKTPQRAPQIPWPVPRPLFGSIMPWDEEKRCVRHWAVCDHLQTSRGHAQLEGASRITKQ